MRLTPFTMLQSSCGPTSLSLAGRNLEYRCQCLINHNSPLPLLTKFAEADSTATVLDARPRQAWIKEITPIEENGACRDLVAQLQECFLRFRIGGCVCPDRRRQTI